MYVWFCSCLIILPSDATNSAVPNASLGNHRRLALVYRTDSSARILLKADSSHPCSWYSSLFRYSSSLSIPVIRTTISLRDTNQYSGKMHCHNYNNRRWNEKRSDGMLRTVSASWYLSTKTHGAIFQKR